MRRRMVIAAGLLVTLVLLLGWQRHREAQMTVCLESGRYWNGPKSRCETMPYAPIIRRALERS